MADAADISGDSRPNVIQQTFWVARFGAGAASYARFGERAAPGYGENHRRGSIALARQDRSKRATRSY
jgi:hypothetical protein